MLTNFDTAILDCISAVTYIRDNDMNILYLNPAAERASGVSRGEALGKKCWQVFGCTGRGGEKAWMLEKDCEGGGCFLRFQAVEPEIGNGVPFPGRVSATPLIVDGQEGGVLVMLEKGNGEAFCQQGTEIREHIIAPPIHLNNVTEAWSSASRFSITDETPDSFGDSMHIEFADLFSLEELQQLQDRFCKATGVAGLIVHPDGTPLSQPSNFTKLCGEEIRGNRVGMARCIASDASLGRLTNRGPIVQKCPNAGLWTGGAAIWIGGRHLASWLIGQVRDENQGEEQIRRFAEEIGADEEKLVRSFFEVPVMSRKQFSNVAEALYTLTQYLSTLAYQNIQQARYIEQLKQTEDALRTSREEVVESRLKLQMALSMAKMGHWEGSITEEPNMGELFYLQR